MVQVRKSYPRHNDGTLDAEIWIEQLNGFEQEDDRDRLREAIHLAQQAQTLDPDVGEDGLRSNGKIGCFASGLEMASILNELRLDEDALIAAVVYRAVREHRMTLESLQDPLGAGVVNLIQGVLRMAMISELRIEGSYVLGQNAAQSEKIREMLVAMVDDVRVGLIKLAERTQAIRSVKRQSLDKQVKVAREVFDIYVPLAHRLGIGHIKWELEDLSFRYLQPDEYKNIAKLLDEKRLARQAYIDDVIARLKSHLSEAHIHAEVDGRAKHIYSIWRKMRRKDVGFDQVFDKRAVRVLVDEVQDCYACLGIVHTLWRNISGEFDDYIANPKPNGYRSLHTAVIGPDGKVVEIQIRTRDMHEEAELGVCAHWVYKGTDTSSRSSNSSYEQKLEWLRQVLEWREEARGDNDMGEATREFTRDIARDRIYVFTPQGHVIDLAVGSTPLDFAYHVHTEVGHRCRGAKVDGRIVPLDTALENGQKVEIITGKEAVPNRDWLRKSLGYLTSQRSRSKVKAWFKKQAREENILRGRVLLESELERMALTSVDYKALADHLNYSQFDDMLAALGAGDVSASRIISAAERLFAPQEDPQTLLFDASSLERRRQPSGIKVSGVGNLLSSIAHCCKPVPGDKIIGYVTQNRGVTIHRDDCAEFLQMAASRPERVIQVSWGSDESESYAVDIAVEAYDRKGLLNDMTTLFSNMRINVNHVNSSTDKSTSIAKFQWSIDIDNIEQLVRVLGRLNNLPNVISAVRVKA